MRTQTAMLITCLLLLLALAPWLISSCSQRPLLPDELRQERTNYETGVETAQSATMEAQRQEGSTRKVIALGTVAVTASAPVTLSVTDATTATLTAPTVAVATPMLPSTTVVVTSTAIATPTATIVQRATGGTTHESTVVIVRSTVLSPTVVPTGTLTVTNPVSATAPITATGPITPTGTPTITTRVVVIRANATPAAPSAAPSNGNRIAGPHNRPAGLVASVDVITAEMLTQQMAQEAREAGISDLKVRITPDGFYALGNLAIRFGLNRPVEMYADFAVENDSLVAKVTSIDFGGLDVTEQYASELEEQIKSGLYQLLPQRYVDSFELADGQVTVQSQRKP
ncbi:MAG: hypothetical protein ACOYNY_41215 [Caldilineaceae bacterium]